jgi:hypothetical protein
MRDGFKHNQSSLPFNLTSIGEKYMAKAYHLKEIIELENGSSYMKWLKNYIQSQLDARKPKHQPLNEIAVWNTALQMEAVTLKAQ